MYGINERVLIDKNVKIINLNKYNIEIMYDENSKKYFKDINEITKYYKKNNIENIPKYVYGCMFKNFQLDFEHILENGLKKHHEDILEFIEGIGELRESIEKFNETNKNIGIYSKDLDIIIELY